MNGFSKPSFTIEQQISLLRERGLHIPDENRTKRYLSNIGYFRLSAYTRPFYQPNTSTHTFIENTAFDDILRLYVFDRELRLLLLDAIERIEVALRAQLANTLAEHYGPHGYLEPTIFDTRYKHDWLLEKLEYTGSQRDIEPFLLHYQHKYSSAPTQPPIWMAVELLSFKEVSTLLANLRNTKDTQRIEQHFGWKMPVLRSWFRSLSDLRNMCAHHSRVWNREFGSRPEMPKKVQTQWPIIAHTLPSPFQNSPEQTISPQRRLYMFVVVIQSLLNVVSPKSRWAERLIDLLDRYPNVSRWHMGFPEDWQSDPFWSRFATSPNKHKKTENSDA